MKLTKIWSILTTIMTTCQKQDQELANFAAQRHIFTLFLSNQAMLQKIEKNQREMRKESRHMFSKPSHSQCSSFPFQAILSKLLFPATAPTKCRHYWLGLACGIGQELTMCYQFCLRKATSRKGGGVWASASAAEGLSLKKAGLWMGKE